MLTDAPQVTQLDGSVSYQPQHVPSRVSFPSSYITLATFQPLPLPHPCHLTAQLIDDLVLVSFPSWFLLHE